MGGEFEEGKQGQAESERETKSKISVERGRKRQSSGERQAGRVSR
jgi:hypothetical protein